MEIGRRMLSESEFSNLWGVLYQEFYNLSVTNTCDATLVYNTIYIICTSGSSFENKLYWKIGDFLLNRCKIHRDQIIESKDYIGEYIIRFEEYQKLVESIHSLGTFLNDCVKEKKLNEFGYLLWERMVIQSFNDTFFIDVFQYPGDIMKILNSFEKITPDTNQKLLYYREKYEKVALQQIRSKYKTIGFSSLLEFCDVTKIIVSRETEYMKRYMLSCSYDRVKQVLEECLLSVKYYELLVNLKNFFHINNLENYNSFINNFLNTEENSQNSVLSNNLKYNRDDYRSLNQIEDDSRSDFTVSFEPGHKPISDRADDSENISGAFVCDNQNILSVSDGYEHLNDEKIDITKIYIENIFRTNKTFVQLQGIINKKRENTFEIAKYKSYNPVFINIMESLGILDAGFALIKKAYALYIESMLKSNMNVLESSVKQVHLMLETLDIFCNADCQYILYSLFRQYLQRTKPCFMKRLCEFTQQMVVGDKEDLISNLKPFEPDENTKIFCTSMELISDRSEFMNMYQNALKERIISGESNLRKEYSILNSMEISQDDRLYKMLEEIEECRSKFKLLNSIYWNIEPENSSLILPVDLLRELKAEVPNLTILNSNGKLPLSFSSQNHQCIDSVEMKYRLKGEDSQEKTVQIAHQYSRIVLSINGILIRMNIYQYIVIDRLYKGPENIANIAKMTGISDQILKTVIHSLMEHSILKFARGFYYLSCEDIQECDISCIGNQEERMILDVCVDSYIQALGVKVLKKVKRIDVGKLIKEIKGLSRLEVNEEFVTDSLKKLVDKGMAETKNNTIEYVF
ncbi:uncharacterized protein VICG_00359 [Vittaforma corneae ATCC 50505]|uniref:Cullin family profile domain-containing protein n=1 Tax=Vittaforma corneae (strain ATCC 50505) TaxID=993615 RepID=L2GQM2_VITCO|nr:uncharacterized protein VICG_00359 [Vittaforma corneae ATCC 50505]ELA42607.1 hypothetical protein VICG_00359 [Vittaforma corneae ATCC 50505]